MCQSLNHFHITDSFKEVLPQKVSAARRLVIKRLMQYTCHIRTLVSRMIP